VSAKHFRIAPSPAATIEPTEVDKAYAAGFFDGEGTVTIAEGRRENSRWPIYNMRVIVGQNDLDQLLWLRERWSGTIVARAAAGNRKQHHTWSAFSRQAHRFLLDVQPYLRLKRERADLAIDFQSHMQRPGSNANRDVLRPFFAECRERMLTLNGYPRRIKEAA
jgi:hypothetical protein